MSKTATLVLVLGLTLTSFHAGALPPERDPLTAPSLLPRDVLGYLAVTDIPGWSAKMEQLATRWFGDDEGKKAIKLLIDSVQQGLSRLPEGARKDIERAMKTLGSLHLVVTDVGKSKFDAAGIIEATDDEILPILAGYLRGLADERVEYEQTPVFRIATGDRETVPQIFLSVRGRLGIVATDLNLIKEILRRSRGKGEAKETLAENPLYRAAVKSPEPSIGAFVDIGNVIRRAVMSSGRDDRFKFDRLDAILGFRKIAAIVARATMADDGEVLFEGNLNVDPGCALWEFLRQKPAAKDCLAYIPPDAMFCYAYTVNDPPALWKRVKQLIADNEKAFGTSGFEEAIGRAEKEEFGVGLDEILGACGDEAAIYMGDFDIVMPAKPELAFLFEVKDPGKAAEIWKKLRGVIGDEWKDEIYKGVTISHGVRDQSSMILDRFLVIGMTNAMKKIVDARKEGASLAANDGFRKIAGKLPTENVLFAFINIKKYYALIEKFAGFGMFGGGIALPASKAMPDDLFDILVTVDTENSCAFSSRGTGIVAASVPTMAIFSYAMMRMVTRMNALSGPMGVIEKQPDVLFADPPTLPEDKHAAREAIAQIVGDLGDDDPAKRTEATKRLKYFGRAPESRDAVLPAVRDAVKSDDPEVRSRAKEILIFCDDFEAMPEVVKERVVRIVAAIRKADVQWDPEKMEPETQWYSYPLGAAEHAVLKCDAGIVELAGKLRDERTSRAIANLLVCYNSRAAGSILAKDIPLESDVITKLLTIVALGWSDLPEAKKIIEQHLAGDNIAERRAAFLAIERSSDPAWVGKLLGLLRDKDVETRFNAGYTLEKLTGGKMGVGFNAFDGAKDRDKAIATAERWWEAHRTGFTIERHPMIGEIRIGGYSSIMEEKEEEVEIFVPVKPPPPRKEDEEGEE